MSERTARFQSRSCRELHDAIKQHPQRNPDSGKRGAQEYGDMLLVLLEKMYAEQKVDRNTLAFKAVSLMYHDFCGAACNVGYKGLHGLCPDELAALEANLGALHQILDGRTPTAVYTYYGGCNIYKSTERLRRYCVKGDYWEAQYTEEELDGVLREFDEHGFDTFMFTKATYEYFTKRQKDMKKDRRKR